MVGYMGHESAISSPRQASLVRGFLPSKDATLTPFSRSGARIRQDVTR